jgi:photosynthetic reaction center H subunit
MSGVVLFGNLDVAELVFYIFFAFFLGLVIYLRREDRREGYPLEEDIGGRIYPNDALLQSAGPKTFRLPHGLGKVTVPNADRREPIDVPNSRRTSAYDGMPIEPVGNPLASGVGPAAYAQRADRPDLDWEGRPRIVPMSTLADFSIALQDADPRGFRMAGADGGIAGTVSDIWVDRAEMMIRYLNVTLSGGGTAVVPMMMCRVDRKRSAVICDAVNGSQFAGSPVPKTAGQITLLEEEKIVGWFGGGYLYANAERAEPLL